MNLSEVHAIAIAKDFLISEGYREEYIADDPLVKITSHADAEVHGLTWSVFFAIRVPNADWIQNGSVLVLVRDRTSEAIFYR